MPVIDKPGRIMSKRVAGIALLIGLLATGASAETPDRTSDPDTRDLETSDPVMPFGDSGWEVFRPKHRAQEVFDLAYMTDDLRSRNPGYGLRFRSSTRVTFDLQVDLLAHSENLYGPIYDMSSGATILSIGFRF